jgi:hypothetical protein
MNKNEAIIQYQIWRHHNFKNVFPNIHTEEWGGSEVDALYLTDAGYCFFYEIKCSLADFKNDFKKKRHAQYIIRSKDLTIFPKQFAYICFGFDPPEELIPEYAGCYLCNDKYWIDWNNPLKKPKKLYDIAISEKAKMFLNKKIYSRFLPRVHEYGKNKYYEAKK